MLAVTLMLVGASDVAAQRADRASLLWLYRDLLALRRAHPALQRGSFRALDAPEGVFAYEREHAGERAVVALNFGAEAARVPLGSGPVAAGLHTSPGTPLPSRADALDLPPTSGVVLLLT